jgi:DNA-directed RNA polymerase subunit M/transcription elongation factor TFIIS
VLTEVVIMANLIAFACPDCEKEIKAPAEIEGKKIRCKACGATFTAKSQSVKAAKAPKAAPAKPAEPPKKQIDDDLEADPNPYGVDKLDLTPRCPHCAAEMESEDSVICLSCGYNTSTRMRVESRRIHRTTGGDIFLWLLPGIICAIMVFVMIGFIVFLFVSLGAVLEGNENAWWAFGPRAMKLWGTIFSLFVIFFCARFAIKRLILHPKPPEREKG